jgi:hypothetical protein
MGESFLRGAPIIDTISIQRHGLRRYETSTMYIGYDTPGTGERWVIPASFWLTQIYCWYRANHEYLSGTATVPYLERGEVGQRLWSQDEDGTFTEFYIEGITWKWRKDQKGATHTSTKFDLTRGVPGIVGEFARFEYDDIVTWDAANQYPIPLPPNDDLQALLENASGSPEAWTDPDEFEDVSVNEDLDTTETINQQPEEHVIEEPEAISTKIGDP